MEDRVSLSFTQDDLLFLEWAMEFIEGGPIDNETEEQRSNMLYRARNALSDYVVSVQRAQVDTSLSHKVLLAFTVYELLFLEWAMEFIECGPIGTETEEQRSDTSYRIRSALSDYKEGIRRSPDGNSFSIKCAFCEGTGAFPDVLPTDGIETEPCPVCEGRGLNFFRTTLENVTKCRFCGGDGRAWDSSGYPTGEVCPVCQGTGNVFMVQLPDSPDGVVLWDLIHPEIEKVSRSRYETSHYSDSVEAAFKQINKVIKHLFKENTGEELDGAPMMYKAFSPKRPVVSLADLSTESGRNI